MDGLPSWGYRHPTAPSVGDAQKTFMIIRHINEGDEAPGGIFILNGFRARKRNRWGKKNVGLFVGKGWLRTSSMDRIWKKQCWGKTPGKDGLWEKVVTSQIQKVFKVVSWPNERSMGRLCIYLLYIDCVKIIQMIKCREINDTQILWVMIYKKVLERTHDQQKKSQ